MPPAAASASVRCASAEVYENTCTGCACDEPATSVRVGACVCPESLHDTCSGEGPLQEVAVIHTLAEVPGSRALLQHNGTQEDASELYEGGSLADVVAAASAAAPHQVTPF